MNALQQFLQSASNEAAGAVSGPVDLIGWALRKAGVPVPQNALMSSGWMKQNGLMADVPQTGASLAGQTFGLLSPVAAAAKAPQIAGGLLKMGENAAKPRMLNPQRGVVPASFVREQGAPVNLPADDLFSAAVGNTPGAQLAPDGLLMRVQRNQLPEQGMLPSTRGGVFYLPEGAAQAKHYSTGRNGYGGGERITGETLIQSPLFVKGATGGKAPEAAIDKLLGKGTYERIRSEAISVSGYGSPLQDKVARAREFLAKYAPELQDQADYIVRNSTKGNQLPYALQEAAVASAVRNAGHDAVLGYSKQRTGAPFLSEVFDVRERIYPDKFGGFGVWGE